MDNEKFTFIIYDLLNNAKQFEIATLAVDTEKVTTLLVELCSGEKFCINISTENRIL